MQATGAQRRRLRKIAVPKRERTGGAQATVEQKAIARLLSEHPAEMLSASNAFLCGWLTRDGMEKAV